MRPSPLSWRPRFFALAPALRHSRAGLRDGLADGGRASAGRAWGRLGFRLVVLELATAVVLFIGAGLLGRSLYRLLPVDLVFRAATELATSTIHAPRAARTS